MATLAEHTIEVVSDKEPSSKESSKPVATGVKVHPINVGQGDAILLEVNTESSKKYLIDGGKGQESETKMGKKTGRGQKDEKRKREKTGLHPLDNLIKTLEQKGCIDNISSTESTEDDAIKNLESIVITHPDIDHYGGIKRLIKKYTISCPIVTTSATYFEVNNKRYPIEERNHNVNNIVINDDCLHFISQEKFCLQRYQFTEPTTVKVCSVPKNGKNATSILTTVNFQKREDHYDVVLTGDSYGEIILDSLELDGKSVGIFQVPHHGSKYNSCTKYRSWRKVSINNYCYEFYKIFDAEIYLISHGNGYKHPHPEVIKGIIMAAVEKKRHCKIVVTATWFDESKIKGIEKELEKKLGIKDLKWHDYVKIYKFQKNSQYVTLDPKSPEMLNGLQHVLTMPNMGKVRAPEKPDIPRKSAKGHYFKWLQNLGRPRSPSSSDSDSDDNSVWINQLYLTLKEKRILESDNGWLNDRHIWAAQHLLKEYVQSSSPQIGGFQDVVVISTGDIKPMGGNGVQIIHCGKDHWACLSTIKCPQNKIYYYDSVYSEPNNYVKRCAKKLLGVCKFSRNVVIPIDNRKQKGGSDCGLFAIATATFLCNGQNNPHIIQHLRNIRWDQSEMRQHLLQCLQQQQLTPFPKLE